MDLSLPLSGDSIEDCLMRFMEPESLQGSERFYCPECKAQVNSSRKLSVYRWPEVLVLHLKRFSFMGYGSKKLNVDVSFPGKLDLSRFTDPDNRDDLVYRLYGAVHHFGSSNGGHYTAGCMQQACDPSSSWFDFDDSHVRESSYQMQQGKSAYILFYKRMQLAAQR
jgi:ubiquitin C-terminal hydrolase